jgi:hypothetical protein
MSKIWLIIVLLIVLLALAGVTAAKYIPYVEPLDGDWGDVASPWQMPGGFSTVLYGRMSEFGDADAIRFELLESSSNWLVEMAVPACGDHFSGYSPTIAVLGEGLPAASSDIPFDLPEGVGAVILDQAEDIQLEASENYLFSGETQSFVRYDMDITIESGEYSVAIWEPNGNIGAYALSILGVHPDFIDADESARMEADFALINSGDWMGQDCSVPLAAAGCMATQGNMPQEGFQEVFPQRSVVGSGYVLSGVVRDAITCLPIANAQVFFWMTNTQGEYDDEHEGMLYTNQQGAYQITSDPPGRYGPEAHVHLFVSAPNYQGLETAWSLSDGDGTGSDTFEIVLRPV